jgi:hypothetical protein
MDIGNNECRFCVSGEGKDSMYCAKPTLPGKSYCEEHYSKIYVKGTTYKELKQKRAERGILSDKDRNRKT